GARISRGSLLDGQGNAEGARAAHPQASDSQHAEAAPVAALSLGFLLESQGNVEGARAAYQLVIRSQHADQASRAAFNRRNLLPSQEDLDVLGGRRSASGSCSQAKGTWRWRGRPLSCRSTPSTPRQQRLRYSA